jgi:transcriptional regulator with XRE-family HTH domain
MKQRQQTVVPARYITNEMRSGRIRAIRNRLNLNMYEMAALLKCPFGTYCKMEYGKRTVQLAYLDLAQEKLNKVLSKERIDRFRERLAEKDGAVHVDLDPELRASIFRKYVHGETYEEIAYSLALRPEVVIACLRLVKDT